MCNQALPRGGHRGLWFQFTFTWFVHLFDLVSLSQAASSSLISVVTSLSSSFTSAVTTVSVVHLVWQLIVSEWFRLYSLLFTSLVISCCKVKVEEPDAACASESESRCCVSLENRTARPWKWNVKGLVGDSTVFLFSFHNCVWFSFCGFFSSSKFPDCPWLKSLPNPCALP